MIARRYFGAECVLRGAWHYAITSKKHVRTSFIDCRQEHGERNKRLTIWIFILPVQKNTIILHDLRLELSNGKVAQIDHLVIDRFLDVYVLESKNWKQLTVDETGGCTVGNGRTIGVPSPLEQCKRHAAVLARTFQIDSTLKELAPRQNILPRVLMAPGCNLKAPHHKSDYIKADAFHSLWNKNIDEEPNS